jgi:type 1 glutamine amidotransferase
MFIMKTTLFFLFLIFASFSIPSGSNPPETIRIRVITGGHDYNAESFKDMLASFGPDITYQMAEFPSAYDMFLPVNRGRYDVLVFYHMWDKITDDQARMFVDCIKSGKPVVVLHHSLCAFESWPEYRNIIGGKYFLSPATVDGKEYSAGSYIEGLRFKVKVVNPNHPVTKGIGDFEILGETYKGYYVADDVTPLLTTNEPTSEPVIGWAKKYGKARIVVFQSGHGPTALENPNYRKLLKQAIEWEGK